ncbi:MAG TPA: sulfotransferase [Kofleriaceae bacterium]|nr:sulfotransferase [Kofleriaceae bacterium]
MTDVAARRAVEARSPRPPKVFGIGLSKTGTTSLTRALELLGLRAIHYPPLPAVLDLLSEYDAATDTSVACMYRELATQFPDTKFILTVRDEASWLRSAEGEFARREVTLEWKLEVRRRLFGTTAWDPARFLDGFRRHDREVRAYFADQPHRLLVMDIIGGQGWAPLCNFLGCARPDAPFPHDNATPPR